MKSPIWKMPSDVWKFWSYCLIKASHKPSRTVVKFKEVSLLPGQFVFGRRMAQKETWISERTLRTCVCRLVDMGMITTQTHKTHTIISIVNWENYQSVPDNEPQNVTQRDIGIAKVTPKCVPVNEPQSDPEATHRCPTDSAVYKEYRYNKNTESLDLRRIKERREKEIQKKTPVGAGEVCVSVEAEKIFRLYPERDPISKRSTGKTNKDKHLIERLLRDGYPLESSIRFYIRDCSKSRTYIKNFRTFLLEPPAVGQVSDRQAEREIISSVQSLIPKAKKENWKPTPVKTLDVPAIGNNAILKMINNCSPVMNMAQRVSGNE